MRTQQIYGPINNVMGAFPCVDCAISRSMAARPWLVATLTRMLPVLKQIAGAA